ncbi:hypothetical protein WG66_003478 [Moniliophthora roreri]|nr:hypothetical protein WG66_003478 [Moniliophthora roreri]
MRLSAAPVHCSQHWTESCFQVLTASIHEGEHEAILMLTEHRYRPLVAPAIISMPFRASYIYLVSFGCLFMNTTIGQKQAIHRYFRGYRLIPPPAAQEMVQASPRNWTLHYTIKSSCPSYIFMFLRICDLSCPSFV